MPTFVYRQLMVFTVLGVALSRSEGQSIPTARLGARLARSADGYTDIVGTEELRDGRVVAVDLRERRIVLLDLARGTAREVARQGAGPKEFTAAYTLVRWLGDSLLVYGSRDVLTIAPNGDPVARIPLGTSMTKRHGGLGAPRFADREGHLYFEAAPPLAQRPDGSFIPNIDGTVLQWNVRADRLDSVGTFRYRDPAQKLVRYWRPYPAKDATAVLPDGRVVFVRASEYRVEIWRDGAREVLGPVVPYTPLRVTGAERDAFRDEMARRPRGNITMTDATGQRVSGAERAAARRALGIPDEAFPERLPPIVEDRATLVDRAGHIWVARTYAATSTDRPYDVFDDHGVLRARVIVPNRGRVVGFGAASVYVVTPDEDDIEWIERYAVPGIP